MKKDGWIPAEERLPEKDVIVLMELRSSGTFGRIAIGYIDSFYEDRIDAQDYPFHVSDLLAWQPLPEPYNPA